MRCILKKPVVYANHELTLIAGVLLVLVGSEKYNIQGKGLSEAHQEKDLNMNSKKHDLESKMQA